MAKRKENHLNLSFFQEALNPKVKIADPKDKTPLPIEEFGKEKTGCAKWTSVFDLKNVMESWKACLRPRPYYKRTLIWLCIGIFCVEIFVIVS